MELEESNMNDISEWDEFWGAEPTAESLTYCIMELYDSMLNRNKDNFNLSPGVQKLISNLPDQEISKKFSSEENVRFKRCSKPYNSLRGHSETKNQFTNAEICSVNIQKMLSNLPDSDIVQTKFKSGHFIGRNCSFLHKSDFNSSRKNGSVKCSVSVTPCGDNESQEMQDAHESRPLGSYLHTNGIASRVPAGRQKSQTQVPSGSSAYTSSSSVSRPVSSASLGSCSSSGSSGHIQSGSAYLASVESLNSEPEHNGSADSGIAEQTFVTPELRVLQEVINTETVYVSNLKEVIEGYLQPWENDPGGKLSGELHNLFSNIEEIYEFNRDFLEQLNKAELNASKIANVFLQNNSGFSVYNEYCTNYPRTMTTITNLMRNEEIAPLFRDVQVKLQHPLPLGSYLLKPVQRILKYHLLLQRLSKQCDPHHKSMVNLALSAMTTVASDINNMKRKNEHAVRVQEIQSQLYGWTGPDLTVFGELVAEGSFCILGARGRRQLFLFEKLLLMAKSRSDGVLSYKQHIMCSNLMLVEQVLGGDPLYFQVLPFDNPRHQCTLIARSQQHKREWTLQIKRVMLENYSAVIPNEAKELVMKLGQRNIDSNEADLEKRSPIKQDTTPHYLERRNRVRKTKNFSKRAASQDRSFSLSRWRRKSLDEEKTKTVPDPLELKKKPSSIFYTDISDSEPCESLCKSTDNLDIVENNPAQSETIDENDNSLNNSTKELTVEKIISDIVMETRKLNARPHKTKNKRAIRESDPSPRGSLEEESVLPTKSDSLPRSFQLYTFDSENNKILNDSIGESLSTIVQNKSDSTLNEHANPDHKIYRKNSLRWSINLLQKFRNSSVAETQKFYQLIQFKQGSKTMGEKIANQDYADPQKLFSTNSSLNLNNSLPNNDQDDLMQPPEELDMSINEKEVFSEIDRRLEERSANENNPELSFSSQNSLENSLGSSKTSPDYYEALLENNLPEDFIRNEKGQKVMKSESFKTMQNTYYSLPENKSCKRPTSNPPPIPVKPILKGPKVNLKKKENDVSNKSQSEKIENGSISQVSWVKSMVERFE